METTLTPQEEARERLARYRAFDTLGYFNGREILPHRYDKYCPCKECGNEIKSEWGPAHVYNLHCGCPACRTFALANQQAASIAGNAGTKRSRELRQETLVAALQHPKPTAIVPPPPPPPTTQATTITLASSASEAEESEADSDAETTTGTGGLGDILHTLPRGHGLSPSFRETYSALADGELGMARLFFNTRKATFVTFDKTDVYVADKDKLLWVLKPYDEFAMSIQEWLRDIANIVGAKLRKKFLACMADEDKPGKLAWGNALRNIECAMKVINKKQGGMDIAKLVFVMGRIPSMDIFDANRDLIAFKTCVYDSSQHLFRPRTFADKLTQTLDYDPDMEYLAECQMDPDTKTFPDYEARPVDEFMVGLFEKMGEVFAAQATLGYFLLGRTHLKFFEQLVWHANSGKTTLMSVFCNAAQFYASNGDVPVAELCGHFSGALVNVLKRRPPVRAIIVDEFGKEEGDFARCLNEEILNVLADGLEIPKALALNKKREDGQKIGITHAKLICMSNGHLNIKACKSGLWARSHSLPLRFVFKKEPFDPHGAPSNWRDAKPALVDFLLSAEARPMIATWIIVGIQRFKRDGEQGLRSPPGIQEATFTTLVHSDPYASYLVNNFYPTGNPTHTVLRSIDLSILLIAVSSSKSKSLIWYM